MAARQDQTLVIVNIVCIVLALGFAVATYFGFRGRSEYKQQFDATKTSLSDEQGKSRKLQEDLGKAREQSGFKAEDNVNDIETAFKSDMEKYAPGDVAGVSYRDTLTNLYKQSKATEASEAESKRQYAELDSRYKVLELQKDEQIKAAEKARNDAQAAAAAERNQFVADRAKTEEAQRQLMALVDQQRIGFETQIAERDTKLKTLEAETGKQLRTIDNLKTQLKPPVGSFEVSDGRVTGVNQGGVIWINLGSADALRPLVTFSVYDADVKDTSKAAPKATIEVTMIMGEHQAEARITSDDPKNPILRGDGVYSPAWHRGKQQHFALTGIIDTDGDGQSDLQLVRNLIGLNDGVLDSYLADDGSVDGNMSVNTRYLVIGKVPEGVFRTKQLDGWLAMNKEATSLGIETITLDQFLDQMGYRPDARAVRLGVGGTAKDFPAQAAAESLSSGTTRVPPMFRPRSAPVTTQSTSR